MPSSVNAHLAGVGKVTAGFDGVARLAGAGRLTFSAPSMDASLAGQASLNQSSRVIATLLGVATVPKSKPRGRTSLIAAIAGDGVLRGFPYGRWLASGQGRLAGSMRATGTMVTSIVGAGHLSDILSGAWLAQGRGSLSATLTARLRAAYEHQIVRRYTKGLQQLVSTLETENGNVELKIEQAFPAGTSNLALGINFQSTALVSVGILADQAITLKTNSPSSPSQTISVGTNSPIVWSIRSPQAPPFTGRVSDIYLSNANQVSATCTLAILLNE
jgi:hypothetical protein